jgi:ribose/xylose/arabinose/galactoside ABC-type transport system permease subunit
MPLVLLAIGAFFALAADRFLTSDNLLTILTDASVTGTLAFGMTFVLITAGIDLSVGSTVTLVTVVLGALLVDQHVPVAPAIALVVALGALIGVANGLLIVHAGVPPLIVTLGMLTIVHGVASKISNGAITSLTDFAAITWFGNGRLAFLPAAALILLVLAAACHVLLTRTTFGANVRAIGANATASRLMGLDVSGVTVAVYALSGTLAAVAGLIMAGKLSAGSAEAGSGLELPAIAAAVLGGTSLFGGTGSIGGTLVGALILSVVFNGLVLLGVPFFYQLVVTGTVLVVAVGVQQWWGTGER